MLALICTKYNTDKITANASLDSEIKKSKSLNSFKLKLKSSFLNKYY